jgi:hypothetical protein
LEKKKNNPSLRTIVVRSPTVHGWVCAFNTHSEKGGADHGD